MKTQIKFVVDRALAERFKQAVLRRRGKLDLSKEGERAIRLYLRANETPPTPSKADPILSVIGIASSRGGRVNALEDERRLYSEA